MNLRDLLTDADGVRLSHTKLWANVAYAVATAVIVRAAWMGTLNSDLFLIYLGVVGASAGASKFLSLKYGKSDSGGDTGSPAA